MFNNLEIIQSEVALTWSMSRLRWESRREQSVMLPPLKGIACNPISSIIEKATCPFHNAIMPLRDSRIQKCSHSCHLRRRLTCRAKVTHLYGYWMCRGWCRLSGHFKWLWGRSSVSLSSLKLDGGIYNRQITWINPQITNALWKLELSLNCNLVYFVTRNLTEEKHFKAFLLE